jgi:hypothetical protein
VILFLYAIMFMKGQTCLKCWKVSKIRYQIASDWNGLRPLKLAILEVFLLVYLTSKSMFLYDILLKRFQSIISGKRISPASSTKLRKQAEGSWFFISIPHFEFFQSAFFHKRKLIKKIKNAEFKLHYGSCFVLFKNARIRDRKLSNRS